MRIPSRHRSRDSNLSAAFHVAVRTVLSEGEFTQGEVERVALTPQRTGVPWLIPAVIGGIGLIGGADQANRHVQRQRIEA